MLYKLGNVYKFILLPLFFGLNANAQSYHTLMSVGYNYASPSYTPVNNKVEVFYLRASLPLKLKNGNFFLLNPDLHRQKFIFPSGDSRECYKTGLVMAYLKIIPSGSVITVLNVSNNFEKGYMGIHSMLYGAGVLATRKKNARLKLKYGLYCSREFFGALIVPLFGLDYKIRPKVRLFGVLPQNMKLEYKHNRVFRSGAVFETPVNSYLLQKNFNKLYLDQRQIFGGLFEDIYITKKIVLQAAFKYPIFNSQKIFYRNQTFNVSILGIGMGGERKKQPDELALLTHGPLIELSLNYRIEVD